MKSSFHQQCLRTGSSVSTEHLVLRYLPGEKGLGITVSRKHGNAVMRNRLRRQILAAFQSAVRISGVDLQDMQIVILPKKDIISYLTDKTSHVLEKELVEAFHRIKKA